jgi:hypothetical protein
MQFVLRAFGTAFSWTTIWALMTLCAMVRMF